MTKTKLAGCTGKAKEETRTALQTLFDNINKGQRKQLVKIPEIKKLFDVYGVEY